MMKVVNFHASAEELARIAARPKPDEGISTFGSKVVVSAMKARDPGGKIALELTKNFRQEKEKIDGFVLKTDLKKNKLIKIIMGMNRSCQERFPGDGYGVVERETFPGLFEFSELDRAPVSKIAVFVHQGNIFVRNLSVCAYIEARLTREGISYQISNNPDFPPHIAQAISKLKAGRRPVFSEKS